MFLVESVLAIILAAGEGKRMKSKHSKVMHCISGKPMIKHVVDAVMEAKIDDITVVVGHRAEEIKEYLKDSVNYAFQDQQLGTGHAVKCAEKCFEKKSGQVIVLTGDTPMITTQTIKELISYHRDNNYSATIMSAEFEDPTGYGRILRDKNSEVLKIVEHKDCTVEEISINEVNSGIYCFDIDDLKNALDDIKNNNAQGEYYLTDAIEIIKSKNKKIGAYIVKDKVEIMGINNRQQLSEAQQILKKKVCIEYMLNGVTIIDDNNTYISRGAVIGKDTIIYPGTIIDAQTVIGEDCVIGPNTTIEKSTIGNGTNVKNSVVLEAKVGENTTVGPFAYLRPNSVVGDECRIGDFVEIKNSTIGNGTKVSHLTYVGDATVGSKVNFGCGTVLVNYDGEKKYRSTIGDNVFIGCNTNLVSPVDVKDGSYIAAGSTITEDIPKDSLAIARARQINKEGWVEQKGKGRKNK